MPRVQVQLRNHVLSRSENGVQFEVRDTKGQEKAGDLLVSKGGARWFPRGTTNPTFLTWAKLAQLFEEHGVLEKKKK